MQKNIFKRKKINSMNKKYASRRELLNWFNQYTTLNKIEDLGKGTAVCKLLHTFDSSFPIRRLSDDKYRNLSLIGEYFKQNKINIFFPIERISLCRMQDNLEFAQNVYCYFSSIKNKDDNAEQYCQNKMQNDENFKQEEIIQNFNENVKQEKEVISENVIEILISDLIKLEDERDFYYKKISLIEEYIHGTNNVVKSEILKLLYETE